MKLEERMTSTQWEKLHGNSKTQSVTINWKMWDIRFVESNSQMLRAGDGKLHYGCCHYHNRMIAIDQEIDKQMLYSVLTHELTHAFLYETQITEKDSYTEEELCWFVAKYGEEILDKVSHIMERLGGQNETNHSCSK